MTTLGVDALIVVASSIHGPEGHLGLPRSGVRSNAAHDHLTDANAAREFLAPRHEFTVPSGTPPASELRRLRLVRDAVRALARGDARTYARRRLRVNQMNQPVVAHALPADEESGDDPPDGT